VLRCTLLAVLAGVLIAVPATFANHLPGHSCSGCASHQEWPRIDGKFKKATGGRAKTYKGGPRSDELLGHHGSDTLSGRASSDVLWGDHDPAGQPASQNDLIFGGDGNDFIYGSHCRNVIHCGRGNDAISVHYGRGYVNCGPGRDIYHVAKSRKKAYKFRNCEKVEYRSESQRGGGLKPLG
jgi:Ca2+-binding RTX toxin-like protein